MSSERLTNLLPPERRATLFREYLLRLGTLILVAFALVVIVHGILLLPSYAFMEEQVIVQEKRVAELSEERAASGFTDLSARIAAFSEQGKEIEELSKLPTASESVRAILDTPRGGIALSAFTFSPPSGNAAGRMMLTGTAATRESLRSFDEALGRLPFVASTDLPLSAYAKESDIPFSITLALRFETP